MIAKTTRGKYTDLTYDGHVVIADAQGKIVYYYGDPFRFTFARSSTKPFQALAALETGAIDHYKISQKELAIMCGSHGGTQDHVDAVASILKKTKLSVEHLQCGAHPPLMKDARLLMEEKGEEPTALHNNCSAKHAAMLISALYKNEDLKSYLDEDHPHQKRILKVLSDFTDMDAELFGIATDGCGAPVHGAPLYKWAQAFARLDDDSFLPQKKRHDNIRRITKAMEKYPEMVSGESRLCTDLMLHLKNKVVAKGGANAFYALTIKHKGLGLAVKVESGEADLLPGIVLEALLQAGIITEQDKKPFESYLSMKLKNHQGKVVGETKVDFKLKVNRENL